MGMALSQTNSAPSALPGPSAGYIPADLASAYNIHPPAFDPNVLNRPIVAVVDAYHAPNVYSDLTTYRDTFGLSFNGGVSDCPRAATNDPSEAWCFKQVDQTGATVNPTGPLENHPGGFSWADETTLDVEMVAAICPQCRILLVEAKNSDFNEDTRRPDGPNMEQAVVTAVRVFHAQYVSMSWGQDEYWGELADNTKYYNPDSNGDGQPDVVYVAAAGDNGYNPAAGIGPGWPASSANVVSVGGTTLTRTSANSRGWSEKAWGANSPDGWVGTGSGCSAHQSRPSWQSAYAAITAVCNRRFGADVSIVADPNTGVAVYVNGGWQVFGGTSAATPMVAALYALAQNNTDRAAPYEHPDQFNDVTTGRNTPSKTATCGIACFAGAGWDGPTGLGTPNGIGGFAPGGFVLHNPGPQQAGIGRSVSWNISALGGGATYAVTSGALPPGLSLRADGVVRGKTQNAGGGSAVITATSGTRTGTTVLLWQSLHVFYADHKPQVKGTAKVGATVRLAIGAIRRDSAHGARVRPVAKVQWLKDGKVIPRATKTTLKITAKFVGHHISCRYTVSQRGYLPLTLTSASKRIR
jgi:hypothetical protein